MSRMKSWRHGKASTRGIYISLPCCALADFVIFSMGAMYSSEELESHRKTRRDGKQTRKPRQYGRTDPETTPGWQTQRLRQHQVGQADMTTTQGFEKA